MIKSEEKKKASLSGLESFADSLYEEGDPMSLSEEEVDLQTPLYDSLRAEDDRYVEKKLIATGGMKEVYLVYDRRTSRQVALAKPLQKLGRDFYDSFLREAHITARLEHPCIINLFGMGVDEKERPFFTMEFKRGRSLKALLADFREARGEEDWPLLRRLGILQKIFEGVSYAHSRRVLHLDLKPANIQVGAFGEVQICDWGLGVVVQTEEDKTSDVLLDPDLYGSMQQAVKGTTNYMAPELFDPRVLKTPQMDIYALGCIMEELLVPASAGSVGEEEQEADAGLEAIVSKAKANEPEMRYRTVEEMQLDLERYLGGFRTSVEKKTARREIALFYRRNRQVSNIILGSLLILFAATSLFIANLQSSRNEANRARDAAEKAMSQATIAQADEERAKIRTLKALEELQEEKEVSEARLQREARLSWTASSQLVDLFFKRDFSFADFLDSNLKGLEAVTEENPPPGHYIWNQKFWMYFLTQQFEKAVGITEEGKYVFPDLVPLARKYALKKHQRESLSDDDFLELLQELNSPDLRSRSALAEKMLEYDARNERSNSTRAACVREVLAVANPDWDSKQFHYQPEARALKIGGPGLGRLVRSPTSRSLLRFLDLERLDLSGTRITNLSDLQGLRLREIDIRNTKIQSLEPLQEMRSLRRVIVTSEQVTTVLSESLSSAVELVEK
ncbi:MAG: protein kinase domain-containing protein [Roseibacillus sp.]